MMLEHFDDRKCFDRLTKKLWHFNCLNVFNAPRVDVLHVVCGIAGIGIVHKIDDTHTHVKCLKN